MAPNPPYLNKQTTTLHSPLSSIGYVVGGGLKENLRVRLTLPAQEVQEGAFVVIESGDWQFYGLVTDLQLGATDPRFADEQSETRLPAELAGLSDGLAEAHDRLGQARAREQALEAQEARASAFLSICEVGKALHRGQATTGLYAAALAATERWLAVTR